MHETRDGFVTFAGSIHASPVHRKLGRVSLSDTPAHRTASSLAQAPAPGQVAHALQTCPCVAARADDNSHSQCADAEAENACHTPRALDASSLFQGIPDFWDDPPPMSATFSVFGAESVDNGERAAAAEVSVDGLSANVATSEHAARMTPTPGGHGEQQSEDVVMENTTPSVAAADLLTSRCRRECEPPGADGACRDARMTPFVDLTMT